MAESTFVHVASADCADTISPEKMGGTKMQRDMEVVRKVLRAVQQKKNTTPAMVTVEGVEPAVALHHIALLTKAGYIEGVMHASVGDGVDLVLVKDLTWEGHEFAGAVLVEEDTWQKVKKALGPEKLATMPLKMIQDIATKALTAWAMGRLGL